MKKHLLITCLLLTLVTFSTQAQDTILKITGEEVKVKVIEITLSQVLFKLPETTQDSIHTLDRKEVFMVTFANGTKEVLSQENSEVTELKMTPAQMALQGRKDAKLLYKGNNVVLGSVAATYLFFPAVVVIGAIPPKVKPSEVSNITYLSDTDYLKAYKKQAHKRKIGKVALGTGIGVVSFTALSIMMLMASFSQ